MEDKFLMSLDDWSRLQRKYCPKARMCVNPVCPKEICPIIKRKPSIYNFKKRQQLDLSITRSYYNDSNGRRHMEFKIEYDGDVFWANSYLSAVHFAIQLMLKDEYKSLNEDIIG